jgi:hypothetical protein
VVPAAAAEGDVHVGARRAAQMHMLPGSAFSMKNRLRQYFVSAPPASAVAV